MPHAFKLARPRPGLPLTLSQAALYVHVIAHNRVVGANHCGACPSRTEWKVPHIRWNSWILMTASSLKASGEISIMMVWHLMKTYKWYIVGLTAEKIPQCNCDAHKRLKLPKMSVRHRGYYKECPPVDSWGWFWLCMCNSESTLYTHGSRLREVARCVVYSSPWTKEVLRTS